MVIGVWRAPSVKTRINQAHELHGVYKKLGLDVYFDVVHGAAHGGDRFLSGEHLERALAFLRRTIGR
jgi:hypothetical protein